MEGGSTARRRVATVLGAVLLGTTTIVVNPSILRPTQAWADTVVNLVRLNPPSDPIGGTCPVGYSSVTGFGGTPAIDHRTLGLGAYAGHAVQLRFSFDTIDPLYNQFEGWYVGNITVVDSALGTIYNDVASGQKGWTMTGSDGTTPGWHTTARRTADFGSTPWWYGNDATGTYQAGPITNPCSDRRNFGTLTSSTITIGPNSSLNFDTLWQIESVNPSSFDIMWVQLVDLGPALSVSKQNLTGDSFYDNTFAPAGSEIVNVVVGPGISSAFLYVDGVQSLNVLAGGSFNWLPPRNPDGSPLFAAHTLQVKGVGLAGNAISSNPLTLYALVQQDATAISLLPDGAVFLNPFSTDPYQAGCLNSGTCPGQPPATQPNTGFRMSNDIRVEGKSNGTAFVQTRPVRQPAAGTSFICDAQPSQAAVRANSFSGPYQDGAFTSYYSTLEARVNVNAPDVFKVSIPGTYGSTNASPFTPWIFSTAYVAIAPNGQAQVKWGDQVPAHANNGNSLFPYHYLYSQGAFTGGGPHPVPQLLPWVKTADASFQKIIDTIIAGFPWWQRWLIRRAIAAAGDPDKYAMEHLFAAYRAECARARFAGLNVYAPNGQQIDAYLQSHFSYFRFYLRYALSFAATLKSNVIPHYNWHEFAQGVSRAGFVRSSACVVPGCPGRERMKIVGIFSPLNIHVFDAAGNHSGPLPDGSIEQGIDPVTYLVDGDIKVVILPNDSSYQVQLQGAGAGVATINVGDYDGQAELRFEQYNAIDVAPGSAGTLSVGGLGTTISYDAAGSGSRVVLTPATAINNPPDPSLDTTPPTTTASLQGAAGQAGYFRSAVDVRLTASDDSSGVAITEYSLDGGTSWNVYSQLIRFAAAEGRYTVSYRSTDYVGNVETPKSVSFVIDLTPPVTTATPAPGPNPASLPGVTVQITTFNINGTNYAPITCFNTSGININLSAVDNLSGVAQINYSVSGAQTATGTIAGSNGTAAGAVLVTSPGISTVSYGAVDLAGNQEATAQMSAAVASLNLDEGTVGAACAFTANLSSIPAHGSGTVSGTVTVATPFGTITKPFSVPFTY